MGTFPFGSGFFGEYHERAAVALIADTYVDVRPDVQDILVSADPNIDVSLGADEVSRP